MLPVGILRHSRTGLCRAPVPGGRDRLVGDCQVRRIGFADICGLTNVCVGGDKEWDPQRHSCTEKSVRHSSASGSSCLHNGQGLLLTFIIEKW